MLIEFRVTNYRSIKEQQVLSLVASKHDSQLAANCIESGINAAPVLLRSAVLYGPNAGGKSNLITALAFMRSMIETSAVGIREGQPLNVSAFRLDPETNQQPSEFEITFVDAGVRYQYGFALTAARIVKEWLLVYVGRKAQCWFEREYNNKTDKDNWYLGSHLTGSNQRRMWKEATRANALFLSTAVNLNSEQLRPIFNWFVNKLAVIANNQQPALDVTINNIRQDIDKAIVIQFLQAADLGIIDVKIEMRKSQQLGFQLEPEKSPIQMIKEIEIPIITLFHRDKNGEAVGIDFSDESEGTKRLFAYAGVILNVLHQGRILVVDELDNSLHPKMLRFLLSLFHNSELNKNNAQLVFSTHDTSLLDTDIFRRDQIWFVEKDQDQASKLYPLTDFSPRKDEALEKGYLMGRYGALPFFGDLKI